jgi:hypothetical protein
MRHVAAALAAAFSLLVAHLRFRLCERLTGRLSPLLFHLWYSAPASAAAVNSCTQMVQLGRASQHYNTQ